VEGSVWVASHSGSGEKQRWGWCGSGTYTEAGKVEVMRVWRYGRECKAVLVEGKQWRQVHTIGINLVVCGEWYKHGET